MRAFEILLELRKKKSADLKAGDTTPHDYNPGWQDLNWLKEQAQQTGERLSGTTQLFVPRANAAAQTPRDRRLKNLTNPYAYDEKGDIKPDYSKWEEPRKELSPTGQDDVREAAPILSPGKSTSPPGDNKPRDAFWTSTARRFDTGAYSSDWSRWIAYRYPSWLNNTGYLYKVKPGALVLELNHDQTVERVFNAFNSLGRTQEPPEYYKRDREGTIRSTFPWDQIVRHFDGVWHGGYGDRGFMYGWDVESTAWFDKSFLQLVGEVPVVGYEDD